MEKKHALSAEQSEELADTTYQPADRSHSGNVSRGLAETHQLVSDMYKEGTIDNKLQ
ncbi:YozQ family protein [Brevibacillus massiliensis]|uniref:YozQ family protein n=1 Tax=Brevibacillus massiliensis TaxID=1118054 RepID=UPI001375C464|nr:YozQ family protein [Brevibacillus massiliensis]